jgi:predicted RNA binding protein YcfA (HicA-like mRNA interferase family)
MRIAYFINQYPKVTHPDRPGHISVPHPRKDLGTGLLHKLFKQAGLK